MQFFLDFFVWIVKTLQYHKCPLEADLKSQEASLTTILKSQFFMHKWPGTKKNAKVII